MGAHEVNGKETKLTYICWLSVRMGCLNVQAEIIPIEPVRVMPERESILS